MLSREKVKEILRNKEYSYLEDKVSLMEMQDNSVLVRISFLVEYKNRMIEEKQPIALSLEDFRVEDWVMVFAR